MAVAASACDRNEDILDSPYPDYQSIEGVSHDMLELGDKLDDPYTVENMTKALARVYPSTKGSVALLNPTDIYVRFLPETEEQYRTLVSLSPALSDHPLDYEIVREGDYYHDPSIPIGEYTWMYAVLPSDTKLPAGIRAEVLDRCYIPDNLKTTRSAEAGEYDWRRVVEESFRMTGNGDMLGLLESNKTKGSDAGPSGRISLVDEHFNDGRPTGVSGVQVCANVFVNTSTCYTDDEGYYTMEKRLSGTPRYRLIFSNTDGFSIGMNLILVSASVSTLGKASSDGLSVLVDKDSDYRLYYRCAVNNAASNYYLMCRRTGITLPPADTRIWLMRSLPSSSCCMLHHGAVVENDLLKDYLGDYTSLLKHLLPDITIGLSEVNDIYAVFSLTSHELAHASHFSTVGCDYWDRYTEFVVRSFVTSGWKIYGNGDENNAGYCEVGEDWAYHMENKLHAQRYPGHVWNAGSNYWFKPQMLDMLEKRGLSSQKIFKALLPETHSKDKLRAKLIELYPEFKTDVEEAFRRYSL